MTSIKPQSSFRSGDLSLKIEGEVVPIVDVKLGQQSMTYHPPAPLMCNASR